jgi:hypothetical protein
VDASGEFCLVNAFLARFLRGDPGDHDRAGLRQVVISRFAVKDLRLANMLNSSSVRMAANCAGRSSAGCVPKVS